MTVKLLAEYDIKSCENPPAEQAVFRDEKGDRARSLTRRFEAKMPFLKTTENEFWGVLSAKKQVLEREEGCNN